MRGNYRSFIPLLYRWSSDEKRDIDVFFKCTLFPRLSAVLANAIAIVGGEEDVSIVQNISLPETFYQLVNHLTHSCEGSEAIAIPFVVVLQVRLVLLGQGQEPRRTSWLVWVEIRCL